MSLPRQEPSLASLPSADADGRRDDAPPRPSPRFPWLAVAGLVAVAAAAVAIWRLQLAPPPAVVETPAPPPVAAAADTPPAIRYPIEAAPAATVTSASANDAPAGEPALLAGLLALPGAAGLDRLIVTEDVVHRFVATIDNLPRATVASKVMLVRPAAGAFATDVDDGRTAVGRDNAARYAPYLRALQSIDTAQVAALYVRNYAAFQQAYRDLGYPDGYFNDRLVDVIDHLLATPEPAVAPVLVQPRVLYEYANPDFEARSAGQKAMLRLGLEGERAAKAKLRDLRKALAAAPPR